MPLKLKSKYKNKIGMGWFMPKLVILLVFIWIFKHLNQNVLMVIRKSIAVQVFLSTLNILESNVKNNIT